MAFLDYDRKEDPYTRPDWFKYAFQHSDVVSYAPGVDEKREQFVEQMKAKYGLNQRDET